jgi:hypothetical protein
MDHQVLKVPRPAWRSRATEQTLERSLRSMSSQGGRRSTKSLSNLHRNVGKLWRDSESPPSPIQMSVLQKFHLATAVIRNPFLIQHNPYRAPHRLAKDKHIRERVSKRSTWLHIPENLRSANLASDSWLRLGTLCRDRSVHELPTKACQKHREWYVQQIGMNISCVSTAYL